MKIICIGRNYGEHARELGNEVPEEPVFFLKPQTAILPPGRSFQIPSWSTSIHYELELVLRIARECRDLQINGINGHVDGVGLGLDLTARDLQAELKKKGLPWEKAKAFDGSAVVGHTFVPLPENLGDMQFYLEKNGRQVQHGRASEMIFSPAQLISHVSRYITLLPGDLLFTGTPAGVGPLAAGDQLLGRLEEQVLIDLHVIA